MNRKQLFEEYDEELKEEFDEWLDEQVQIPTHHSFAWLLKTADPAAYEGEFREWCDFELRRLEDIEAEEANDEYDRLLDEERCRIDEATGFDQGDPFEDPAQVREYFTPENQRAMFGDDALTDGEVLAFMCYMVLENEWHCAYRKEEDYI